MATAREHDFAAPRLPFQIQAEILRNPVIVAPDFVVFSSMQMPFALPGTDIAGEELSPIGGEWCNADLERAIEVAESACLQSYRIEITPDGTISVVVGSET